MCRILVIQPLASLPEDLCGNARDRAGRQTWFGGSQDQNETYQVGDSHELEQPYLRWTQMREMESYASFDIGSREFFYNLDCPGSQCL